MHSKVLDPATVVADLNRSWRLYPDQAQLAAAIFRDKKRFVVARCGRKTGKTACGLYCLSRGALTKDRSIFYWFAPKAKQAREIVWASGRLQNFVPKKYIKKIKDTEMRVIFYNDSFIKLDGSDEYEQYRGVECDGALYDEAKDFHPLFDVGFRPNLGPRKAFLLVLGTPPRNKVTPSEIQFFAFEEEAKARTDGFFLSVPSWSRTDHDWIEELKRIFAEYERRYREGDLDALNEWRSEYGAEYIQGGPGSIFPMLSREKHTRPRIHIIQELQPRLHDLEWWCIADPGTNHAFGVLFIALDRERSHFYVLDEIKEKNQYENTTGQMYERILDTIMTLYPYPQVWNYRYDEAALWFKAHIGAGKLEDFGWMPTAKQKYRSTSNEVKPYLSLLKSCFIEGAITIAEECSSFWEELSCYKSDENGKIQKINDDLLDPARYFLAESSFELTPQVKEKPRILRPHQTDRVLTSHASVEESSISTIDSMPLINMDLL